MSCRSVLLSKHSMSRGCVPLAGVCQRSSRAAGHDSKPLALAYDRWQLRKEARLQHRDFAVLSKHAAAENEQEDALHASGKTPDSSEESKALPLGSRSSAISYAYVAFGSNVGDRVGHIESALREMRRSGLRILRSSRLYETAPMYVEDQAAFLNGVCEVCPGDLTPLELLARLQGIENALGRQRILDKGPRNIDLDLILFKDQVVEHEKLKVPHEAMTEREFVLRPLCDLIPEKQHPKAPSKVFFSDYLAHLPPQPSPILPLTQIMPSQPSISPLSPSRQTQIMAIINLTPDSFSDGGYHPTKQNDLLPLLSTYIASGATILDIGGQSTRPHAPSISSADEIARVLPVIRAIRQHRAFDQTAISIDTYRAPVAAAAIAAGATMINDVSAGTLDPTMLPTAARLGCPIVLTHMRGTPATMASLTDYTPAGLLATVAAELRARLAAAEAAGVFRWRVLLDPGIGFAKNARQNLALLRRLPELRGAEGLQGLPWILGSSRKAFVGEITAVKEARRRVFGTAATVAAAVAGGADVVRVHDVEEMRQVVRMSDAIWRAGD